MDSTDFELSDLKKELLSTEGNNILALGGPGSGKTTIALLKAQKIILEKLSAHQKVLFLSFARATISRVEEKAKKLIKKETKRQLEINTYHGFAWNLLRSHGYLLNKTQIELLPPPEAASRLAPFSKKKERSKEKQRLFYEEGLVHFDLFASLTTLLLSSSKPLASIYCTAYPVIILDEFQDTNQSEWDLIQELGKRSRLIALGDQYQRIYEFRGADPKRLNQFVETYDVTEFNFSDENHRSNGTDIVTFGNDILEGTNKKKTYQNIHLKKYQYRKGHQHLDLKVEVIKAAKGLHKDQEIEDWSLTILVPTKNLMLQVSDYLSAEQKFSNSKLPDINHNVSLEMAGPSLAAVLISKLLGKEGSLELMTENIIVDLSEHMRGRNGNKAPSKSVMKFSSALEKFLETNKVRGKNRKLVIEEAKRICGGCKNLNFVGEPAKDWIKVRSLLLKSKSEHFRLVGEDSRYLRLLRKGAVLNAGLSDLWRGNGSYDGASDLIKNALLQEHFSTINTTWSGINIMTMHASKGKEFDEVIIYDGPSKYRDRILRNDANDYQTYQTRLTLRVAVTRAMRNVTILTPSYDPYSEL